MSRPPGTPLDYETPRPPPRPPPLPPEPIGWVRPAVAAAAGVVIAAAACVVLVVVPDDRPGDNGGTAFAIFCCGFPALSVVLSLSMLSALSQWATRR